MNSPIARSTRCTTLMRVSHLVASPSTILTGLRGGSPGHHSPTSLSPNKGGFVLPGPAEAGGCCECQGSEPAGRGGDAGVESLSGTHLGQGDELGR